MSGARMGDAWLPERALTRLAALGTLSRNAGEGLCKGSRSLKPLSRPPQGWAGEVYDGAASIPLWPLVRILLI